MDGSEEQKMKEFFEEHRKAIAAIEVPGVYRVAQIAASLHISGEKDFQPAINGAVELICAVETRLAAGRSPQNEARVNKDSVRPGPAAVQHPQKPRKG
jgi:hypothetical protein